ncbi:hypothetical protein Droror1_Dr00001843 [Drosera rotundifolia]
MKSCLKLLNLGSHVELLKNQQWHVTIIKRSWSSKGTKLVDIEFLSLVLDGERRSNVGEEKVDVVSKNEESVPFEEEAIIACSRTKTTCAVIHIFRLLSIFFFFF